MAVFPPLISKCGDDAQPHRTEERSSDAAVPPMSCPRHCACHGSAPSSRLSSRTPPLLCKCHMTDLEGIRADGCRAAQWAPDWNPGPVIREDGTMTAQILDGKATAAAIKSDLTARVAALKEKGVTPGLGTILVGDDPGSQKYVAGKHRDCAQVGIASIQRQLPATATQEEIEALVRELNEDPACTGYIVQLPLPKGIDENRILELMDPDKDADGLHPMNLGRLVLNEPAPLPCTPNGVLTLLRRYGVEIKGAEVVVVGRGVTIGRSMPLLLTRRSEKEPVTQCHTGVAEVAGFISPNPGGVGPMTRAQLLVNVVEAAERSVG